MVIPEGVLVEQITEQVWDFFSKLTHDYINDYVMGNYSYLHNLVNFWYIIHYFGMQARQQCRVTSCSQ